MGSRDPLNISFRVSIILFNSHTLQQGQVREDNVETRGVSMEVCENHLERCKAQISQLLHSRAGENHNHRALLTCCAAGYHSCFLPALPPFLLPSCSPSLPPLPPFLLSLSSCSPSLPALPPFLLLYSVHSSSTHLTDRSSVCSKKYQDWEP